MNRRTPQWVVWVGAALLLLGARSATCAIDGLRMVGIGSPPDTVSFSSNPCLLNDHSSFGPDFERWNILDPIINLDVDLLYSDSFDPAYGTELEGGEVDTLLRRFDADRHNIFDLPQTDLQLAFNYMAYADTYDVQDDVAHFETFPECSAIGRAERGHVDVYLYLAGKPNSTLGPCYANPDSTWGDHGAGNYEAYVCHYREDPPYTNPSEPEFHANSIGISDGHGHCYAGLEDWPVHQAAGAVHEFGHFIWRSNEHTFGKLREGSDFNEFFASAASVITKPKRGQVGADAPFDQSLLYPFIVLADCFKLGPDDVGFCRDHADYADCRQAYRTWAMWAAYLSTHFHFSDYTQDALYLWARVQEEGGVRLARDMCGLARVFDAPQFASLGGDPPDPGDYRLRKAFHDFAIAKWVDDPLFDESYYMGPHLSPARDFGLFRKVDQTPWYFNCWELAIPPDFVVGPDDTTWLSVPGNASECPEGWNDPADEEHCFNEYCDPVKVRLWGSDYITVRADTTSFVSGSGKYIRVELNWDAGAMAAGTELWLSVLKYRCNPDSLFLHGDQLATVASQQYSPSDTTAIVNLYSFGEGSFEAVTLVLSLVQTSFERELEDCGLGSPREWCMQRMTGDDQVDLTYSYRYRVLEEETGGSCPFAEVGTSVGFEPDNNVLAGAVFGTDQTDFYHLEIEPALDQGSYLLRLVENERELSHFDAVDLLVIDHPPGVAVSASAADGITTYAVGATPIACFDEQGQDLLDLVAEADGSLALVPAGSWVEVHLPLVSRGGGVGTTGKPSHKIDPPGGGRVARGLPGSGVDLSTLCYRENLCTSVLSLPNERNGDRGVAVVRLMAPTDYYVDRLFLAQFAEGGSIERSCSLESAVHSEFGDCAHSLRSDDGESVDLAPGETLDLRFSAPELGVGLERDFVLVTDGHFERLRSQEGAQEPRDSGRPSVSPAYPNPFTTVTRTRFEVPSPGGRLSVKVYNLAGRLVRDLGEDVVTAGTYEIEWDGSDRSGNRAASGVYFLHIESSNSSMIRKVVLLK